MQRSPSLHSVSSTISNASFTSRRLAFRLRHGRKFKLNEKLFIHSLSVILNSLKPWMVNKDENFEQQLEQIRTELRTSYHITPDRMNMCQKEAKKRADGHDYMLTVAVFDSKIDESFSLSNNETLRLEIFYKPRKWSFLVKHFDSIPLKKNSKGKWFPILSKKSIASLCFWKNDIGKSTTEIKFTLKRGTGRGMFSALCSKDESKILGELVLRPTEIHPEGFNQWVKFGKVSIKLRLRWLLLKSALTRSRPSTDSRGRKHYKNLNYYLYEIYNSSPGAQDLLATCPKHMTKKCRNTSDLGKLVKLDEILSIDSNNLEPASTQLSRENDLQIRNDLMLADVNLNKPYCVNNKWCNMESFYHHNPLFRFIMAQDHRLNRISDQLTIPYHFRELCRLMSVNKMPCISLLASIAFYVERYLNIQFRRYLAKSYVLNTDGGKALVQSYSWLRLSVPTSIFYEQPITLLGEPLALKSFGIYHEILLWLRNALEIDDQLLCVALRLRFFAVTIHWVNKMVDSFIGRGPTVPDYLTVTNLSQLLLEENVLCTSSQCRSDLGPMWPPDPSNDGSCKIEEQTPPPDSSSPKVEDGKAEEKAQDKPRQGSKLDSVKSDGQTGRKRSALGLGSNLDVHKSSQQSTIEITPAMFQNILKTKLCLSPQIFLMFKLHDVLSKGLKYIPIPLNLNPKLRKGSAEFVKELDNLFRVQLQGKYFELEVLDSNSLTEEEYGSAMAYFKLKLYSTFYDIQRFIYETLSLYLTEPHEFRFIYLDVNFFTKLGKIEAISETKLVSTNSSLFFHLKKLQENISNAFDNFYFRKWGVPKIQFQSDIKGPRFIKLLLIEYHAFMLWYTSGKQCDVKFLRIPETVKSAIAFICKTARTFLKYKIRLLKDDSCGARSESLKLAFWLAKAVAFNLTSTALVITRKAYDLLRQINKDVRRFASLTPGWYKVLRLFEYFDTAIESLKYTFEPYDKNRQIDQCLADTSSEIKSLFRALYIKLTWDWLEELYFLNGLKFREKMKSNKLKLFPLLLMAGLPLVVHFHREFRYNYAYVRRKLHLLVRSLSDKKKQTSYSKFIEAWAKDIFSVEAENPFASKLWLAQLHKDFTILNSLWKDINPETFQKTRQFPTEIKELEERPLINLIQQMT